MSPENLDVKISEEELHVTGPDGLNLRLAGRIPDKWGILLLLAIASMLGFNELGVWGP